MPTSDIDYAFKLLLLYHMDRDTRKEEKPMLDDMNVITQRDRSDALRLAEATPKQLLHDFKAVVSSDKTFTSVVFAAMGGSALQAEFVKTYPVLNVPFVIVKDYNLPNFVNESTLVIVSSYSGNTEESLSALEQAVQRGATIAVMAGGGKLLEQATQQNLDHVVIPKAVQPRMAVLYAYRALIELLVGYGLTPADTLQEIERAVPALERAVKSWTKTVPTAENPAKQLALQLVGKSPIIYSGPLMAPAAYKWKISANENAKNTAWTGTLPEFNHNEFIGWSSHPVEKPFTVIDLLSSFEHPRTQKRFEVTDRLLSGMRPKAVEIHAVGETAIEQLLYLVIFGDFVTLYLGLLNGVDPSPVELVERFKVELG
ncbi:MAG: bifunctional phosphoglucose/phosphomannose isomerase [Candidatus Saccharimonadales bacterium]